MRHIQSIGRSQRVTHNKTRFNPSEGRIDVHFIDDTQTIRYEQYTDDGYMKSSQIVIEDEKEYFMRKLLGE